jgi:hypothetical protein
LPLDFDRKKIQHWTLLLICLFPTLRSTTDQIWKSRPLYIPYTHESPMSLFPFLFYLLWQNKKKQEGSSVCVSNYKQNRKKNKKVGDGTRSTWNGHKVYFSALAGRYTHIEEKCIAHDGCSILFIYFSFLGVFFSRCPNGNKPCRESPLYTHHRKKNGVDHDTVQSVAPPPLFFWVVWFARRKLTVRVPTPKLCVYTLLCYISLTASARSRFNGFSSPKLLWRWPIERYIGSCTVQPNQNREEPYFWGFGYV